MTMDLYLVARTILSAFLLLDFQVSQVSTCQCSRHTHPQQYMCGADYVIRGKVLSEDFVRIGEVKSSKETETPTVPAAPTTKRPAFKFPQWAEHQWWQPVLRPPSPQDRPNPQWHNPFLGIHNLPPLMLADQPLPPSSSQHRYGSPVRGEPRFPVMVADDPRPDQSRPVGDQPRPVADQPLPEGQRRLVVDQSRMVAHPPLRLVASQPRQAVLSQPRPAVSHPRLAGSYREGFPWQYRRRYQVKVDKVYKGEERIASRSIINVYTETNEGMCGKELRVDARYLIAGYYVDGEIFIDLCDWVVEKSKLTKDQRRGLRHTYKKYCDVCKIKSGTLYWPPEAKEKDVCPYNPYLMDNRDCEGRYSSCVRLPDGSCNWMQTKGLKDCKRKSESVFLSGD